MRVGFSLAAIRKTHFSGGEPMTEKKDETVFDKIRREAREKQEAEVDRQKRLERWAKQDDEETLQELWDNKGANR